MDMKKTALEITPETNIGDLLKTHPQLEEELIKMAPPFKKLKNPFLRRGIGTVASLKHVSSVGNIPINQLINKINEALGNPTSETSYTVDAYYTSQPSWFSNEKVVVSIIEEELEDKNNMTLVEVSKRAKDIKEGEILELITTFLPAVGIDVMRKKGYESWSIETEQGLTKTYFIKK
jgi:TusA-related sulfurtransferase